jgi:Acetyltransferase (GNAT) family
MTHVGGWIMITRVVGSNHPISRQDLHGAARKFFRGVLPKGTSHATVIACSSGTTLGWLRLDWDARSKTLQALGTWVEPAHRTSGAGRALWRRALRTYKPKRVVVTTVTRGGRGLVAGVVRDYPNVTFEVKAAA